MNQLLIKNVKITSNIDMNMNSVMAIIDANQYL